MAVIPDKYMDAQDVEEVAELLKEDGREDASPERTWQEVCYVREHADGELSLDELNAVAGGVDRRNWYTQGCAATVEPGSSCWGTDGGCTYVNISYWSMPGWQSCIYCGARFTYTYDYGTSGGGKEFEYACRECKRWFTYNKRHGQWEEVKPRW